MAAPQNNGPRLPTAAQRWAQARAGAGRLMFDADQQSRREAFEAEMRRRQAGLGPSPPPAAAQQQPLVLAPAMHVHMPEADERSPLERMGDNVEDAYRRENDSRVEQAREARRLGFARDMEAMRQEGLLQRLQAMNESSYEPAQRPQSGGIGVFNPYTHQFEYGSQLVNENGVRYLDGRRLD